MSSLSSAFACLLDLFSSPQVVAPMAANYSSGPAAPATAGGPFSWVPRQMLSGDAAEEEGESDGDSDRGDEDRGEGDEAELVIDIPNEWAGVDLFVWGRGWRLHLTDCVFYFSWEESLPWWIMGSLQSLLKQYSEMSFDLKCEVMKLTEWQII